MIEIPLSLQYGGYVIALGLLGLLGWMVKAVVGDLRHELHEHTQVSREMHLLLREVRTLLQRQNGRS